MATPSIRSKYTVGIVDDHVLFAKSLDGLINTFKDFTVSFVARNGNDMISKLDVDSRHPDVILLDINMPIMNGPETLKWLEENQITSRVLALSMDDGEETIINMLSLGAKGYLLKDIHPDTLKTALCETINKGHYYSDQVTEALLHGVNKKEQVDLREQFTDRELQFLELACSDKPYKEIADIMCLSPKTIDNYRDTLFKKLEVRSRIGMVLYALKHELVKQ
ncbi:MAG: response regulator transcription factor [Leeuwenhoekiella sp.]